MLNPTLINQFNESPHAIYSDGTIEQLEQVLKYFWPHCPFGFGSGYYFKGNGHIGLWDNTSNTDLPGIPVTSFFTPIEKTVKVSEVMAWVEKHQRDTDMGYMIEPLDLIKYLNNI